MIPEIIDIELCLIVKTVWIMLLRSLPKGCLCITQSAHARISGQLARAWGNEQFGSFIPWDDVCLAAEQHDIGWLRWEAKPTLNPTTHYPYHFTDLPIKNHIEIWEDAPQLSLAWGRYVALLISRHGTRLYERHTSWQQSAEVRPLVEDWMAKTHKFQRQLIMTLQDEPDSKHWIKDTVLERNLNLIAAWDWISILLCLGVNQAQQVSYVPALNGTTTLTLTPINASSTQIQVRPWPFCQDKVYIDIEGRTLNHPIAEPTTLHQELEQANWLKWEIVLCSR